MITLVILALFKTNSGVINSLLKNHKQKTGINKKIQTAELLQLLLTRGSTTTGSYENLIISGYIDSIIDYSSLPTMLISLKNNEKKQNDQNLNRVRSNRRKNTTTK
jgi:hypothetical protein